MAMQQAAWAPYINAQGIDTFNSDIDLGCYEFNVNYQFDFATICHKSSDLVPGGGAGCRRPHRTPTGRLS